MDYKELPIGISDFTELREGNYYYVDKTEYLTKMEKTAKYLFFTRPRRFGKSLFVSMVRDYYDINARDRFEAEFKGTWIYDHPTENHSKYQVLYFDFSLVKGETIDDIKQNFNYYCGSVVHEFMIKYGKFYDASTMQQVENTPDAGQKLAAMGMASRRLQHKLYIIVDEYDNFTNNILTSKGIATYTDVTHGTGFYRDFLKIFKAFASRYMLIGISPCTLDDVTSGLNNFVNITTDPDFNMALGFSEKDVRQMIDYYQQAGLIKRNEDDIIDEMRPWYDNYCFSRSRLDKDPKIFNSNMVLYYLRNLIKTGEAPEQMIDPSTKTDYAKLRKLVGLENPDRERREIINKIATNDYIYSELVDSYPAEEVYLPENFPSQLFYMGMLTIGGMRGSQLKLIVPNQNVREQLQQFNLNLAHETAQLERIMEVY